LKEGEWGIGGAAGEWRDRERGTLEEDLRARGYCKVRSYMYSGDHITGHRDAPDLTFDI
jgi:hypothetical protein